jgi:hypothetical protein
LGEANRRRAALASQVTAIPSADIQMRVYEAVHSTLRAFGCPGVGDCLYHAAATVGALQGAGIEAQLVAGAVWWAVGPGAADTATHGYQNGRISPHLWRRDRLSGYDGVRIIDCHAVALYRVAGVPYIVDMTTYQIPEKARLQSESDGMPMNVTMPIAPYYWGRLPPQRTWDNAMPGDWCFTPVNGLGDYILEGTSAENLMIAAPLVYANPDIDLAIFGEGTWTPEKRAAFRAHQPHQHDTGDLNA